MSLRLKFVILFLVSALVGAGYVLLYWMPASEQASVRTLSEATNRELETTAETLISPLLQNQLALIYENLSVLVEKRPNWVSLLLVDGDGQRLYPLNEPETTLQPGQMVFRYDILFRAERMGTLTLVVDFTQDVEALRQRNQHLAGTLLAGFLVILILSVLLLDIFVSRPVRKLSLAAGRLADGDFDAALPSPGKDEVGDMVGSFAVMRESVRFSQDQLTRARAVLEASETRFRDFSAAASDWYWEMDADLRLSYLSETFAATTGMKADLFLGKHLRDVGNPGIDEADWTRHLDMVAAHD